MKKGLKGLAVTVFAACIALSIAVVPAFAAETVNLNEAIKDAANWDTYQDAPVTSENGVLTVSEKTQIAAYKGDAFYNKMIEFTMKSDATAKGTWPTFCVRDVLGAEKPHWEGGSAYTVTFKGEEEVKSKDDKNVGGKIELNAYKAGTWVALGEVVPNPYFWGTDANKEHKIQFGAIDEADGVRIILKIDGKEVFNYLDKENPIKEKGTVSIYAWSAPVSIGSISAAAAETKTGTSTANPKTGDAGLILFATAALAGTAGTFLARKRK